MLRKRWNILRTVAIVLGESVNRSRQFIALWTLDLGSGRVKLGHSMMFDLRASRDQINYSAMRCVDQLSLIKTNCRVVFCDFMKRFFFGWALRWRNEQSFVKMSRRRSARVYEKADPFSHHEFLKFMRNSPPTFMIYSLQWCTQEWSRSECELVMGSCWGTKFGGSFCKVRNSVAINLLQEWGE